MNEQDVIEMIRVIGRYEVISESGGKFTVIPIIPPAVLIAQDSHEECTQFFNPNES